VNLEGIGPEKTNLEIAAFEKGDYSEVSL